MTPLPLPTLVDRRASGTEEAIASEAHAIGEDIANYVQLTEVPKLEDPSTVTVGGTPAGGGSFSEVSATPDPGEFRVHYSGRLAGRIEFNAADAGIDVTVSYEGTGSPVAAPWFNRIRWSVNREDLAGDRTIAETDERVHSFDPGGATRVVTLPAEKAGLMFLIGNRADAAEDLTVQDDAASTLLTLNQDDVGLFFSDGTGWIAFKVAGAVT